jgi:hypothetical protein
MWPSPQPTAVSMKFTWWNFMMNFSKTMVVRFYSVVVSWLCVKPTSKRWFLKIVQVTMETWFTWCHVGIRVDFKSVLYSLIHSVGPSSIAWSELGLAPPLPPMRVLEMQRSRATILCVKWPWPIYLKNGLTFGLTWVNLWSGVQARLLPDLGFLSSNRRLFNS